MIKIGIISSVCINGYMFIFFLLIETVPRPVALVSVAWNVVNPVQPGPRLTEKVGAGALAAPTPKD